MSSTFADLHIAAAMKGLIVDLAEKTVDRMRPEAKLGKVFDVNPATNQAEVLFAGDTFPNTTLVKAAWNMMPTQTMLNNGWDPDVNPDPPANIVRINGSPGKYYISEFVSGYPRTYLPTEDSLNFGRDYDGHMFRDLSTGKLLVWNEVAAKFETVYSDIGWENASTTGAGDAPWGGAWSFLQFRMINDQWVHLTGQRASNAAFTAASENYVNQNMLGTTLPTKIRPTVQVIGSMRWDDAPQTAVLTTGGQVVVCGGIQRTYASGTSGQFSFSYVLG